MKGIAHGRERGGRQGEGGGGFRHREMHIGERNGSAAAAAAPAAPAELISFAACHQEQEGNGSAGPAAIVEVAKVHPSSQNW